jgi:phosphohistidine phosphatase SixA
MGPGNGARRVELLLRAGVAFCFIGHGVFGILRKPEWLAYFSLFRIPPDIAFQLMPVIGAVDIAVGILAIVYPARAVFLYAAFWALWTAALRPLAGEGVAEMLERAGNYGVPLALLAWVGLRGSAADWLRRVTAAEYPPDRLPVVFRVCQWTTALLLTGHGVLALTGKPLLAGHLAAVRIPHELLPALGVFELALAALCIARPAASLFMGIAAWKLATELLFPLGGAPVWEFIERGGSYVAPTVAALLCARSSVIVPATLRPAGLARTSAVLGVCLLGAAFVTPASAQGPRLQSLAEDLITQLRGGGYVLACRHGITNHEPERNGPSDPLLVRPLNGAGEAQMRAAGEALRALGIAFSDVRTSAYLRTRRSAALMFGGEVVDSALYGSDTDAALRVLLGRPVRGGGNRALVTHQALLRRVLGMGRVIEEGDCIVVRPNGSSFELVAHVPAEAWQRPRR